MTRPWNHCTDTFINAFFVIGHCTFEGGFCGWTNDVEDDFDWELGRSSKSFLTGPSRDYSSYNRDEQTGGYSFIDASFPRRPGDKARLLSPNFLATGDNNPVCMKFATHMFGNGIGTLRVLKRVPGEEAPDRVIWEVSGESGNKWYRAQVSVSSATSYQISSGEKTSSKIKDSTLNAN
ncbi:UNVERIFIED_CONTAM: MAM and LDL-receptor class A domain-containing protein 1 [Trichonephila clavipes]